MASGHPLSIVFGIVTTIQDCSRSLHQQLHVLDDDDDLKVPQQRELRNRFLPLQHAGLEEMKWGRDTMPSRSINESNSSMVLNR